MPSWGLVTLCHFCFRRAWKQGHLWEWAMIEVLLARYTSISRLVHAFLGSGNPLPLLLQEGLETRPLIEVMYITQNLVQIVQRINSPTGSSLGLVKTHFATKAGGETNSAHMVINYPLRLQMRAPSVLPEVLVCYFFLF